MLDEWATNLSGPVAIHLKQKLVPIEGEGGVIFPPTYANIGYNIDVLSDGKKVATIDSVGSQANRMEPLFKEPPLNDLIPQIQIKFGNKQISILDVGHRLGDALIRSTNLSEEAKEAFEKWLNGDAGKLAKLAPTSIIFGAWDSRDTSAKLPRIIQSVIRAWDVDGLSRSATYFPPVDYAKFEVFSEEEKTKAEGDTKNPLAQRGFVNALSTSEPGGIIAHGPIYRDVTVNLITLRRLKTTEKEKDTLRKYILGLSLMVVIQPFDGFLRQGCLLTPDPAAEQDWVIVMRDGRRLSFKIDDTVALEYAKKAAKEFGVVGKIREVSFEKQKAVDDSNKVKGKKNK